MGNEDRDNRVEEPFGSGHGQDVSWKRGERAESILVEAAGRNIRV